MARVSTTQREAAVTERSVDLAERAHLHRTYLSDIERGARNLSLVNIEQLAVAVELSLAGLFKRVEET